MNQKSRLAKTLDSASLLILLFLVILLSLQSFIKNFILCVVIVLCLTVAIFTFLSWAIKSKIARLDLSAKEQTDLDNILTALKFGDPQKLNSFWLKALSKLYPTTYIAPFFKIKNNQKDYLVSFEFSADTLSLMDLKKIISVAPTHSEIIIFAPAFSDDALSYSGTNPRIHTLNATDTFKLLKKANLRPILPKNAQITESKFKILSKIISKKFAIKYLRFGLLLIVFSLIIPYKTLYRFLGIALIILGLISFFKKEKTFHVPDLI